MAFATRLLLGEDELLLLSPAILDFRSRIWVKTAYFSIPLFTSVGGMTKTEISRSGILTSQLLGTPIHRSADKGHCGTHK